MVDIETVSVGGVDQSAASGSAGAQRCVRLLLSEVCRIVCVRPISLRPAGVCRIVCVIFICRIALTIPAAGFPGVQCQYAVVRQYREFQDHLIHLGVAVPTDAEYLRLPLVEHGDDFLRRVALRQIVPGTVIEYVPQEQQPVCVLSVKSVQHPAAVMRRAVYIRCYHYFHILSLPPVIICRRYGHYCAADSVGCPAPSRYTGAYILQKQFGQPHRPVVFKKKTTALHIAKRSLLNTYFQFRIEMSRIYGDNS